MGKVIKDSTGKVLLASSGAFEVTAAIDSNIVAGNIKKDVEILGVTGTYEGSGGGGGGLNFYPCSLSSGAKGGGHGSEPGGDPAPETVITFYALYPSAGATPIAVLIHDKNNAFLWGGFSSTQGGYALVYTGDSVTDSSYTGTEITVMSLTGTLATLQWRYPMAGQSFDPSGFEIAPIYAINYNN